MTKDDRITLLETMIEEEREKVRLHLAIADSHLRGLLLMARMAFLEAPAGTPEEANSHAVKQHAADLLVWAKASGDELRGVMSRALPVDTIEAPLEQVPDEAMPAQAAVVIH